jgi:TfoX/Sxy family transcriptional regulator of competence genes
MACNTELVNRIRLALAHLMNVGEKKMFGGVAFMVDNKMCITAGADRIIFRVDPVNYDSLIIRTGCGPVIMKGREYRGYIYVDADSIETNDAFGFWVRQAHKYNKLARLSKSRK